MSTAPETFHDEIRRFRRALAIYNFRWHLSVFPRDLVRHWWRVDGRLPWPTSRVAYRRWKEGRKPGHLSKAPPYFPQLRVIEGGAPRAGNPAGAAALVASP